MSQEIPFYEQPLVIRRQRLKNKNFSIIAQNCAAGHIYHQLGLKFLSPTINLYFYPEDFIELIKHLPYYMGNCPLVEDKQAPENFPVGILGNENHHIRLYFNHYPTFEKAKEKWESRRQRINFNNLYVIGGDSWAQPYNRAQMEEFDRLPIKNKVIFTGAEWPGIKSAYKIENCNINGHLGYWWNKMDSVRGGRLFEQFDYINFLNDIGYKN